MSIRDSFFQQNKDSKSTETEAQHHEDVRLIVSESTETLGSIKDVLDRINNNIIDNSNLKADKKTEAKVENNAFISQNLLRAETKTANLSDRIYADMKSTPAKTS